MLTRFPADPALCSKNGLPSRRNATFQKKVASRRDETLFFAFATSKVKGSVTEENLNVVVDVTAPEITSVSVYNRLLTIDYSEPVTCPQLNLIT